MSTEIYRILFYVLATASLFSCQMEAIDHPQDHETIELQFTCSDVTEQECSRPHIPDTKTAWTGKDVTWSEGDRIAVTYKAPGSWSPTLAQSEPLAADCMRATFSVPVEIESKAGSPMTFHAVHPASCTDLSAASLPKVNIDIPRLQSPSGTSFDPAADIMTAVSENTYTAIPSDPVPLIWTRAVAHAEISLLATPVTNGETLESIVLEAQSGADLVGSHVINLSDGSIAVSEEETGANILTVNASSLSFDAEGNLKFNVSVLPCTLESLKITVVTDSSEYYRTITAQIPLKVDRRHTMSVDMSTATRTDRTASEKDALVNSRIFSLLDLNASGLEIVRQEYQAGHLYNAAVALKQYWLGRTGIVNTEVNLSVSKYSASEKNIADQALEENGYRFYVKNYKEGVATDGSEIYYSFLGPDGGIDWEVTPVTETQFALQKHRHQWIEPQAKVYRVTGDEKYAQAIVEVYSDWLETYPCPGVGQDSYIIASKHPLRDMWTDLQATSHISTYINAIDYCLQSEAFTPEFLTHLLVSLYDTVESIRANLYHKAASNHRLFEVQAIYNAAVLLPEFISAPDWEAESYTAMAEQRDLQFASDGVQNEMDPGYHISVVAMFYQMYDLARKNNRESLLPEGYVERLRNACRFVRDVMYPNYSMEDFNDTRSSGWSRSVLKKNFTKYADLFPEEESFLWMATEGVQGAAPTDTYNSYQHSGWYMLRSGWNEDDMMLIMKNNYNANQWWHCQPDNGTISLYRAGRRFLPDAGAYSYGGADSDDANRSAFSATSLHNTMTVDGETIASSRMLGVFISEAHTEDYDMYKAKNQSYPAIRHERSVFYVKTGGFFVVADAAIGSASGVVVALNWHLCPGETNHEVKTDSFICTTDFSDGNNLSFRTFCFNGTSPATSFDSIAGTSYTSETIGVKTERDCYAVSLGKTDSGTAVRFITVITPVTTSSSLPSISASYNSASSITVTVDGKTWSLKM